MGGILILFGSPLPVSLVILLVNFMVLSSITFGLVQLLALGSVLGQYLLEGLIIMGSLPTTVSSCNVLTQTAGGNEAIAVVNSVISNTVGVFLSPALILLYMGKSAQLDVGIIFLQLGLTVVVPMVVGVGVQLLLKKQVAWIRSKVNFSYINQAMILFVIYCTFCDTFSTAIDLVGPGPFVLPSSPFPQLFFVLFFFVEWERAGNFVGPGGQPEPPVPGHLVGGLLAQVLQVLVGGPGGGPLLRLAEDPNGRHPADRDYLQPVTGPGSRPGLPPHPLLPPVPAGHCRPARTTAQG